MDVEDTITALNICARTSPCPENCPRYAMGEDGEECARQLMVEAAQQLGESERDRKIMRAYIALGGVETRPVSAADILAVIKAFDNASSELRGKNIE